MTEPGARAVMLLIFCLAMVLISSIYAIMTYNVQTTRLFTDGGYCEHVVVGTDRARVTWSKPPRCGMELFTK